MASCYVTMLGTLDKSSLGISGVVNGEKDYL